MKWSALKASGLLLLWLSAPAVAAHPVSVSRTLVYVSQTRATVTIEVFLEDLLLFHNLQPNDSDFLESQVIQRGIDLHRTFVIERFLIEDESGRMQTTAKASIIPVDIPARGVPLADLMSHKLTFEFSVRFETPPRYLTFTQRFSDRDGILPSEMQFQVQQEAGGELVNQALLPNEPLSVRFDWSNPPLAESAATEERLRWVHEQQQATLGITSYSAVYSFLYIEEFEVRHEILMPLLTLEKFLPVVRDDDGMFTVPEQDESRSAVAEMFRHANPLEINGTTRRPQLERCEFYGLDFRDFAVAAEPRSIPVSSARVGIIQSYPLSDVPRQLTLTWDLFHASLYAVSMVVFDGDHVSRHTLSRLGRKNQFAWSSESHRAPEPPAAIPAQLPKRSQISVPLVLLALLVVIMAVGIRNGIRRKMGNRVLPHTETRNTELNNAAQTFRSIRRWQIVVLTAVIVIAIPWGRIAIPMGSIPVISDNTADDVFLNLHQQVYAAFAYRSESQVYDALEASTAGDFLQTAYLQIQSGLKMQEQGGAVARIREVTMIDNRRLASPRLPPDFHPQGFVYRCCWHVAGTVEHWGHVHERVNQYEAVFRVEPVHGCWKLTDMEMLDEQQLSFSTRLRIPDETTAL